MKSRRDRMKHLNSFETQEVREIGRREAGESSGFPILRIEITPWMKLSRGKKGMQKPGDIENVKKIHVGAREVLQHGFGNYLDRWRRKKKGWRQPQEIY